MEKDLLIAQGAPRAEMPPEMGGDCGCERPPEECGCHTGAPCGGADSWGIAGYPLAMVYAPCQSFVSLYDPETALARGTLFTELDLPLGHMGGCACRTRG